MSEAIFTHGLTKKYSDIYAVKNLNLCVHEGELFSLLGINGAGKTTTIKMLCGLIRPTSGEALLLGKSIIGTPSEVKEYIAVSPQETAVAPNLSVKENLILMAGVQGLSKQETASRIDELTERLHLDEVLKKRAKTLSGGWQRRLSIAMALISSPKILFLDEPTLGLDVLARSELWDVIRLLKGSITVILTTHYMEEAQALSDRVGIMKRGELIATGTPEELMRTCNADTLEKAFITLVKEGEST